jgi:hypothetical protein
VIFWRIWGYQRGGIWTVGDWAVVDLGFRRRFGAVGEFWRSVPGDLGCRRLSVALSAVSGGVPGDLGCRWSVVVSAIRFPAIDLGFRRRFGAVGEFWRSVPGDLGCRRLSVALSGVSGGVPGDLGCRWSVVVSAIRFPAIPAIGAVVNLGFRTGESAGSGVAVAVLFWCAACCERGLGGLGLVGWTCNLWFGV